MLERVEESRGNATMTAIDEIVYVLNESFSGTGIEETSESQSLLVNLASVDESMWRKVPGGGTRTIESIALHVGSCKIMYDEYAFGEGRLTWEDAEVQPWAEGEAPMDDTLTWLSAAHERLLDHLRQLNDGDLAAPRKANWGEERETRWLISTLIQHDTYHSGEINHIRSVLGTNDNWRWGP
jgi:uncharacterized damage-inducible protein DinB